MKTTFKTVDIKKIILYYCNSEKLQDAIEQKQAELPLHRWGEFTGGHTDDRRAEIVQRT